jgi:hypothetical protein
MKLCEESWMLWQRLSFRCMVAPHATPLDRPRLRRLRLLRSRARRRYYRRKQAIGGSW